ncbi:MULTISPECIES: DegT/DnrJ/EryC1/StrS family aminotransferase [unclassified Herbaspirillum]|uniref:DegT/DnrJ/EryC1/StrS family aminotransferase n=1 Tax=unclassified Herbaspirillum TaxID=2624150 RepID=UPI000E2EFF6D|nr:MULTISPECIES: DegT/DnrJ/EryC1/StrS family aminotransferase [unclassified Herbaspirillum]RFB71072.1 DegT/DnrJ/EryC1/StrS family aminotransferase [Herbaspirillum sp. 3R-3a1]TFI08404.1 DegT/DnrJ/EryC1/StrS family aminotransferase [Herbaspirillum sp. 3R11]TFI14819.1 DegT/DnrJ/EryC1/StrS family aminotransferase [Herbaspirillum sp. 3R-11]TFI29407.1 DegT/DnrJ/EryC1/StrS family aminotransferase [Herbaspirillum sp. 3C11]
MADKIVVPFVDLARQFRGIEAELTQAFLDVGRSGGYIMGARLESFERKAAEFIGVRHALGVADGSDALFLVLKALDIGPGDEVITATNSFIASAWVIAAVGATPVLVDVAEDFNIDPKLVEAAVTPRTKAIIPVHLTGRPAPMDEINAIAQKHGLFVLEDAAQAIGARYRGKRTGALGHAAGFSLHPLKNLGVYGDGGLITTDDDALAAKLRLLRNHGLRNRDECEIWGFNSRLDTMQAAFAEIKLGYLDGWNTRCREIANTYATGLGDCVQVPVDQAWEECVYHNFVIRTERRDALMAHLLQNGVDTRVHYPIPIHLQDAAKHLGYKLGDFPHAELYAKTMISLPIYPELSDAEVNHVVDSVRSFF